MIPENRHSRARNGDVSLAYEVFGPSTGTPLLLMMGVGMQMVLWHEDFCHGLVERGFQVARMDNRDVGIERIVFGRSDMAHSHGRSGPP